VLDDSYNANPTSMVAALEALAGIEAIRRVAIVGLMAELGADAERHHRDVAAHAMSLGIELVVVDTELYGIDPTGDVNAVLEVMDPPGHGEVVLLKGSRVAGLDRVAREWHRRGRPAR
jgi:UDP-N-acetylmuramoyl-tripeptide--D-alanyl-D-alanine ligase